MKKLLQKWLEIPPAEKEIIDLNFPNYITECQLKNAVEEAIYEALSPDLPELYRIKYFQRDKYKDLSGLVQNHIKSLARELSKSEIRKVITEKIEPEKFIDDVVERIKNKQLKL
ncbi:MAG: hypothetical protein OXE99_06070 [Cellvibrionales bacterium]|nr:hypothetical protein [Cellvibrionales bacterium]